MIAAAVPFLVGAEEEEFDPDLVTPGVVGFVATFLVMVVVVLLILDMVRRIRRVNYRAEVRQQLEVERLEAELAASDAGEADGPDATTATSEAEAAAASDDEDDTPPTR
ncbi:hypothetical protein GCM10023152_12170 [Agromyces bauzanensis]|uniref:Uncharacterized protein n=1 Tax=Agromyces bauzanensis TaxID=1308924 RepID=A0A917P8M7_9MICO|nr:hypothetical protein GCM10011372_00760 [Agromyces bauzanensis]